MEPQAACEKTLIFVVGMHRSGTSVVTRTLNLMGAEVGTDLLDDQKAINADGFWEHRKIVALNEKILNAQNSEWYDTRTFTNRMKQRVRLKSEAVELLTSEFISPFVVIKDPRICLTLPLWLEAALEADYQARIIFVFRNPVGVVDSLLTRDPFPRLVDEHLWLKYNLTALQHLRNSEVFFLQYEKFVSNPLSYVTNIKHQYANLPWKTEDVNSQVDELVCASKTRQVSTDFNCFTDDNQKDAEDLFFKLKEFDGQCVDSELHCFEGLVSNYEKKVQRNKDFHEAMFQASQGLAMKAKQLTGLGAEFSMAQQVVVQREETIKQQGIHLEDFHKRISEKDDSINNLKSNILSLQQVHEEHIKELEAVINSRDENIVFLESELQKNIDLLSHAEQVVKDREQEIRDQGRLLEKAESLVKQRDNSLRILKDQLDEKFEHIKTLQADLENKDRVIGEIQSRLDSSLKELEYKNGLLAEHEQAVANLESELNKNVDLLKHAENVVAEREQQIRQQGMNYEKMEKGFYDELEKARLSILDTEKSKSLTEEKYQSLERQYKAIKHDLQAEQEKIAGLESQVREKDLQLKKINDELLDFNANKKMVDLKMRLTDAIKKLAALEQEKKQLHQQLVEKIEENDNILQRLEDLPSGVN